MARGLQKLQSQAKNLEKQNKSKSAHDNKKTAQAGLLFQCVVCKVNFATTKNHTHYLPYFYFLC